METVDIISATPVDSWRFLSGFDSIQDLQKDVHSFVQKWEKNQRIIPEFQLTIQRFKSFLTELVQWVQQSDLFFEDMNNSVIPDAQKTFIDKIDLPVSEIFKEFLDNFESIADAIPTSEAMLHKAFSVRELHPFLLCSPYFHRAYTKPLGYAGDYEIVNFMLRSTLSGDTTYAKLMNKMILNAPTVKAHQNRIDILVEILAAESRQKNNSNSTMKVLNIGCGPAVEIQRLVATDSFSKNVSFHLLDFDPNAISYTKSRLEEATGKNNNLPKIKYINMSVHDLLMEAAGLKTIISDNYDIIYCAGLFDYLSKKVCKRLLAMFYDRVSANGLVLATNVCTGNPTKYFMEYLMEWHLKYRTEKDMYDISPNKESTVTFSDTTGVNVFMKIRKPG